MVETRDYCGWENSFSPIIADVLEAVEQTCPPDGVLRVGLRYVDEIRVPGVESIPGDWSGYIAEQLPAASDSGFIPASLRPSAWQGLVQYQVENGLTLTVRYGPLEGYAVDPSSPTRRQTTERSGPFFLLDSDSFWQSEDTVPEFVLTGYTSDAICCTNRSASSSESLSPTDYEEKYSSKGHAICCCGE